MRSRRRINWTITGLALAHVLFVLAIIFGSPALGLLGGAALLLMLNG